ncbi:YdcF family protein [Lacibacter luteus]|uniref:YdcF family protein n=1 Tax=Lacibacter luteus TaxID=2508719 RepID=A0A4Q1CN09_9BACT|nr:YdcF family protein [Lacibacter luteus]RXK62081.1 YdcF family protein [Lacibacter luteus]
MFFILSKVFNFLLSPFNWLLVLVLLCFFVKDARKKKRWIIITCCWFLIFSNPYIIHKLTVNWQANQKIFQQNEQYSVGILLSGFVGFEFKSKQGFYGGAADRFIQAVRLYKLGYIKKILITGGSGSINSTRQQFKEADFVTIQLQEMGVPKEDILTENQSRNTYENALFSKKLLDSTSQKGPFLLITSAIHMKRSQQVFTKAGIATVAYPCNFNAIDNPQEFLSSIMPSHNAFTGWDIYLKEVVGLFVYKMTGKA